MASSLDRITINGFKSIQSLQNFGVRALNVLVGANGSGKSNFVDFFRLLRSMADGDLQGNIARRGGADTLFFGGPKITEEVDALLAFGQNEYQFRLGSTAAGGLIVTSEAVRYIYGGGWKTKTRNSTESGLRSWKDEKGAVGVHGPAHYVFGSVSSWMVYHFHDTSDTAPARRPQGARDYRSLHPQAGNIAAFLLRLREAFPAEYEQIRYVVQLIAPYLDDFILEPEGREGQETIRLEWKQRGVMTPMQPYQLSDGTLRFICLVTALLQPAPPATILVDEPELGLHPAALEALAGMMREASNKTQVIVSTQSATLLDLFEPSEVVVVDRVNGASTFTRLEEEMLREWLEEFTLGDIWRKNAFKGGPYDA